MTEVEFYDGDPSDDNPPRWIAQLPQVPRVGEGVTLPPRDGKVYIGTVVDVDWCYPHNDADAKGSTATVFLEGEDHPA